MNWNEQRATAELEIITLAQQCGDDGINIPRASQTISGETAPVILLAVAAGYINKLVTDVSTLTGISTEQIFTTMRSTSIDAANQGENQ